MVHMDDLTALKNKLDEESTLENKGGRKNIFLLSLIAGLLILQIEQMEEIKALLEDDDD